MNEVLRVEKKYLMTIPDSERLAAVLGSTMIRDEHNGAEGYNVRSLYFDTPDDKDFADKLLGIELRRKIRLRCYSPEDSFAVLEMKQKEGQFQKKRSLRISREDAIELSRANYSPLLKYAEPFAAECYGLMNYMCYRPRSVVEYKRRAYIERENRTRVTLDSRIVSTETCFDLFSSELMQYPVMDPFNVVLEVKYNGFLLSYVKDIINMADRSEISVSKYCLSRGVGLHYIN